jgi:hypothetical protein
LDSNGAPAIMSTTGAGFVSPASVVLSDSPTISSPTLTNTPVAPTASSGDNTTQIATDAFVQTAVAGNTLLLRNPVGILTPTALTACGYMPIAGRITGFHATAIDGATAATVLIKVETQPTRATFISTGVAGASDISNGGEQLTAVLGKDDTTLTGWTTTFTAGTTICMVGSGFSAGTAVQAMVTLGAN